MANVIMIDYFNPFARLTPAPVSVNTGTTIGGEVQYKQVDLTDSIPEESDGREVLIAPLVEDLTLNIETSFKKPSSMIPGSFQTIVNLMELFRTAGGQTSRSPNILDILDVPVWEKTEPLKFDVKLSFFLDTNAYNDVVRPVVGLAALSMLSPRNFKTVNQDAFLLPGINFSNLSETLFQTKVTKSQERGEGVSINYTDPAMAKIISLEIPGIIYLPAAIVEKCTPVFSKEITESGYPIWGEIQLSIASLRAANTDMFVPGVNTGMASNIQDAAKKYQSALQNDSLFGSGQRSGAI